MGLTLTQSDLDAMPSKLRDQLALYLKARARSRIPRAKASLAATKISASPLDQQYAAALLRDVSFHPLGKRLHALLDRLAYDDTGSPPTRRILAAALPARERPRLSRYVVMLNRLAAKAAKQSGLRLCRFVRSQGVYAIHPSTRQVLRALLPGIKRAGEHEEPLWE